MRYINDDIYVGGFGADDIAATNAGQKAGDILQKGMMDIYTRLAPAIETNVEQLKVQAAQRLSDRLNQGLATIAPRQPVTGSRSQASGIQRAGVLGNVPPATLLIGAGIAAYFLFGKKLLKGIL